MNINNHTKRFSSAVFFIFVLFVIALPRSVYANPICYSKPGFKDGVPIGGGSDSVTCTVSGTFVSNESKVCGEYLPGVVACCVDIANNTPICIDTRFSQIGGGTTTTPGTTPKTSDQKAIDPIKFIPNSPIPGLFDKEIDVDSSLFGRYVSSFYIYFSGVAGIIAIVMIMWGGFHYITSAGNSQKMSEGKDIINNAVIGLVLLFTAYLLLNTINPRLTKYALPTLSVIPTILQPQYYCESAGPNSPQMIAARAQHATCNKEVNYTVDGATSTCISLAVTTDEQDQDIACVPTKSPDTGNVIFKRMKASAACDNNEITPDGACSTTQSLFKLEPWLKGACKLADIRASSTTVKDVCVYSNYYTCLNDYTRISCNEGGTVGDSTCWRDGKPRVYNTGTARKIRAHCIAPDPNNKPIEFVDGICCRRAKKENIYCSTSSCANSEVEISCDAYNGPPGQFATRPIGTPGPTDCAVPGAGNPNERCCAPIIMQDSQNHVIH